MQSELPLPFRILNPLTGVFTDTISTYTVFFIGAFLIGLMVARHDFRMAGYDPRFANNAFAISLPLGFVGGKIGYAIESYRQIWVTGELDLMTALFSPGGLVFYGGLLSVIPFLYFYFRTQRMDFAQSLDLLMPALALGYAVGRLGCMVSGDGCYGHQAHLELPVLSMVIGHDAILPSAHVPVYNTPLIEATVSFLLFIFYRSKQSTAGFSENAADEFKDTDQVPGKIHSPGLSLALFLIVNGSARFLVEFVRLNPPLVGVLDPPRLPDGSILTYEDALVGPGPAYFFQNYHWSGFTLSQIIAVCMIVIGFVIFHRARSR